MPSDAAATAPRSPNHFARLSDGKSAGAHDAKVLFALRGLEIADATTGHRQTWDYDTLKAGEPIRRHSVDVLLSSARAPGASLFVPGPEFARELAERAPHLTARSERWRHARPWIIGVLAVLALMALGRAVGFSPSHAIANFLPETWRERLGREAIRSMTEGRKRCVEPEGLVALDKLMKRLSDGSGRKEPFKVVVADWSLMNAFAVPGSQIVMTKGLIDKAGSADEVAGVLAHEMGHGIELHPETGIIRAVGLAAALEFMVGGTGGSLANLGVALAQLSYTRAAEHEADLQAISLLRQAQISPKGFGNFFKRVAEIESEEGFGKSLKEFDLLRTHPPTAARAELVRQQPGYPATPALDEASWRALQAICTTTLEDTAKDQ